MNFSKVITNKDVTTFLEIAGDENELHVNGKRLVPGNLLITILESYCPGQSSISLRFYQAVYVGEKLKFKIVGDEIMIFNTNDKIIALGAWNFNG